MDEVDQFIKEKGEEHLALEDFLLWLNSKTFSQDHYSTDSESENELNMELSFRLVMQNRQFKSLARHALANSELSSPDSFSFLYHLDMVDSYRKMELVRVHGMEAPSGIEVLKRLLSKKYIEEFDDPDDKRAKRVRMTWKGKKELQACLPVMNQVFRQMTGNLSVAEKLQLISSLKAIGDYHQ